MKTVDQSQLSEFAGEIARDLAGAESFCLWLSGDLGAGKTTTTGYILRAMGLSEKIPVTSPTFTYFNEYKIGDRWYGHMDLYRATDACSLEEIGVADRSHFHGHFVEWGEQIPESPIIKPTHRLTISLTDREDQREFDFRKIK